MNTAESFPFTASARMSSEMSTPPLVLIVEDEPQMRRYLHTFLSRYHYRLVEAATGDEALALAAAHPPDLVLLDLGLPDMDGQEVIERLRDWLQAPIIVVSGRHQISQKIMALENGADDYLMKPFSAGELLARIQVAFRHVAQISANHVSAVFKCGDLMIDRATRRVTVGDTDVRLTPMEYKLLVTMARHAGKVLTHQFLIGELWGQKREQEPQHLRVFMATLRRKIEHEPARPRYLITEQGVGYRMASG